MYTKSTAIGFASLLLGTSATPLIARQIGTPVSNWNLTTFSGDSCDDTLIHSFQGSGSESCDLLTGSVISCGPGGPEATQARSVLARTTFGTYDFSFFPDQTCTPNDLLSLIYEVDGSSCLSLNDLDPQSFNVNFVSGDLKSRAVETRQGPLDTWGAQSFESSDCSGDVITTVGGTNATSCNAVPTSVSCCPNTPPGHPTCDCLIEVTIGSLLVSSDQGTHDFTVYAGDECEPSGFEIPEYLVAQGDYLCITLPTAGSAGTSYQVTTE